MGSGAGRAAGGPERGWDVLRLQHQEDGPDDPPADSNVNDGELREAFLDHLLMDALAILGVDEPPRWGAMSAQHMLEHLRGGLSPAPPEPLRFPAPPRRTFWNGPSASCTTTGRHRTSSRTHSWEMILHRFSTLASRRRRAHWERGDRIVRPKMARSPRRPLLPTRSSVPSTWMNGRRVHFKHGFHHLMQFGPGRRSRTLTSATTLPQQPQRTIVRNTPRSHS